MFGDSSAGSLGLGNKLHRAVRRSGGESLGADMIIILAAKRTLHEIRDAFTQHVAPSASNHPHPHAVTCSGHADVENTPIALLPL